MYNHKNIARCFLFIIVVFALTGCSKDSPTEPVDGPDPVVVSIEPSSGTVGTEVKITGTHFRTGAQVQFNNIHAPDVDYIDGSTIFVFAPAGIDSGLTYTITVRNTDGTFVTYNNAFTVVGPDLMYVNSATKPSGNVGGTVIIEGKAFSDRQGDGTVLFSDGNGGTIAAAIASPADWTDEFIITTVPQGAETGTIRVRTATGLSQGLTFTVTETATFSPSVINWTRTTDLPVTLSGHTAQFVPIDVNDDLHRFAYVFGGGDNSHVPQAEGYYTEIEQNGHVGSWNSTNNLPSPRAFHASTAATPFNSRVSGYGYVYVMGGISENNGQPRNTVYKAKINQDGSLGNWTTDTPLPEPLHSLGALVFRGSVYIAGGATIDNASVNSVYRALIDTLGNVGQWEQLPDLPGSQTYHWFSTFGGFLYAVAGESGSVSPNDGNYTNNDTKLNKIVYSRINLRNGELSESGWITNPSELTKRTSKHTAMVAGGNIFVTAGLYNGAQTGSTENSYATINSDGSVGSFNGATGSNTINGQGGGNLFNHAGISYVDADGVARVMILGGDKVNTPGNKSSAVWFY
jgi:hypothetical protein